MLVTDEELSSTSHLVSSHCSDFGRKNAVYLNTSKVVERRLWTWLKCDFFSLITIRFSILPTQILQQYLLMRNNYVSILSDTSAIVYTKCENLVRHGAYA